MTRRSLPFTVLGLLQRYAFPSPVIEKQFLFGGNVLVGKEGCEGNDGTYEADGVDSQVSLGWTGVVLTLLSTLGAFKRGKNLLMKRL